VLKQPNKEIVRNSKEIFHIAVKKLQQSSIYYLPLLITSRLQIAAKAALSILGFRIQIMPPAHSRSASVDPGPPTRPLEFPRISPC
jgi:hypothetical protein